MNRKVWLVTGCSTGFGREIAKHLIDTGHNVVVTARRPEQLQDLEIGHEDRVLAIALDVTKPKDIENVIEGTLRRFGKIDVLVNNAGIGYFGSFEESEPAKARQLFEVNFWGLAAMIRAVLPTMRAQRSGTIVNITSMGGIVSFPALSFYNASKYAVEGLSEAIALEVGPLGIKVLIVEPGPFRTDWAGRSADEAPQTISDYELTAGARSHDMRQRSGRQTGDPVRAAVLIVEAAEDPNSPAHLVLGKSAVDVILKKLNWFKESVEALQAKSISADFPEHFGKIPGQNW